ncbi:MAG TPA: c-type cytochrome domain-containing protein [Bacteroidota bacterium]
MTRRLLFLFGVTALLSVCVFGQDSTAKKKYDYKKNIVPLLRSNCMPCHAAENENPSGLALDTWETLMKGGEHGDTIVPGKPKESNLYLKLLPNPPFGKQMARNKKKLTEEEVMTIYHWIEQGAKKE